MERESQVYVWMYGLAFWLAGSAKGSQQGGNNKDGERKSSVCMNVWVLVWDRGGGGGLQEQVDSQRLLLPLIDTKLERESASG